MKRYINYFLTAVCGLVFLPACNDNEIEYNKGEEPLTLTLSNTTIVLDIRHPNDEALTFSWTTGTNAGTNSAINYLLQIDRQGNQFESGLNIELGRRIYTHKYTCSQLNDLLLGDFNVLPNEAIALEARIVAMITSENVSDQSSEVIPFTVTAYQPVSANLFIIGSATTGGWNLDKATAMNPISEEAGGFVVTSELLQGDFKFITTTEDFLPSYNRDANSTETKLIYRQSDNEPDEKFVITSSGRYRIAVNIIDLTIEIEELEPSALPRYDKMYFVGDFTGWSFIEMTKDPFNPFVFRYGAVLNGSGDLDFKFGTSPGDWSNMLHPTIANAPMTHTAAMFDDAGDNKWKLTPEQNNKAYKIAIDITEDMESMTMAEYTPWTTIFVIGDASPIGWSLGDRAQTQMTKSVDDYTYTWTGTLSAGEIKFKCSDDTSWDNDDIHTWYMAPDFDLKITPNTDMVLTSNLQGTRGSDRKWIVEEGGTYVITINQLTEKIRFDKQ
jgi:hypothetical protein